MFLNYRKEELEAKENEATSSQAGMRYSRFFNNPPEHRQAVLADTPQETPGLVRLRGEIKEMRRRMILRYLALVFYILALYAPIELTRLIFAHGVFDARFVAELGLIWLATGSLGLLLVWNFKKTRGV